MIKIKNSNYIQIFRNFRDWWQIVFRNKIAGFLFGRYKLNEVAEKYISSREKYFNGMEIIFWGEEIYLIIGLLIVFNIILSIIISPFLFLLTILYVPILMFFTTNLELVMITDERILIEKRSLIEKISRTQQFQSINIDQIAMMSYSRAPPNLPLLVLSVLGFISSLSPFLLDWLNSDIFSFNGNLFIPILLILPLISFLYLIWFSLRLNRRSIELFVIGIQKSIGIGRIKGAPTWFLSELQNVVTERIHHTFHNISSDKNDEYDVEVMEYPLQYSSLVRDLVKEAGDEVAKALILQIDNEALNIQQIYDMLTPIYTTDHVDDELSYLKNKTIIVYNPEKDQWELNRKYKRKYLHEDTQRKL